MNELREMAKIRTLERFTAPRVVAEEPARPQVVRPIDGLCRHCAQREPLNDGRLCRPCIEIDARNRIHGDDLNRLIKSAIIVALFAVIAIAFGWMTPPSNQQQQTTRTTGR